MIHTKNKRDPVSQKKEPGHSVINGLIDNCLSEISFNKWKSQLPRWLTEARNALLSGNKEDVAEILNSERIEQVLKEQSGQLKIVVIYNIVKLLREIGQLKRAESLCGKLQKLQPDNYIVYNEMGTLSWKLGNISGAVKYFTKSKEINPDDPDIWCKLGNNLARLGQIERGMELFRNAVEKTPEDFGWHSNLLFHLHYLPDLDRQEMFNEHKKWAQIHAPPSLAKADHNNIPDPDRQLRIGYISPDFRGHSVAIFLGSLLESHHSEEVEVYGYGDITSPDSTTEQLKNKFDYYRNIRGINDKSVADLIEQDQIDILVDLAGHTGDSRLHVLAYKPAPLQVTWLGYPDTTGMSQIDYRLTDSIADPVGSQKFYTEKLIYLPNGFLCFSPCETLPAVADLSSNRNGRITFGSFNISRKINSSVVELWSRILKSVPNSDLLLKFKSGRDDEIRQIFLRQFEAHGINPERITISGWLPSPAHLQLYNHIDIALDTYPYNGTTTTCQALSMSVPVISLSGDQHMSRVGRSLLSRLGLEFFAASTPDEYVSKAVALAAKPDALAKIRETMRDKMAASTLCNKSLFARNIEQAYRNMWKKWCNTKIQNQIRC